MGRQCCNEQTNSAHRPDLLRIHARLAVRSLASAAGRPRTKEPDAPEEELRQSSKPSSS
jgi:hypothetical protein